MKKNYVRLIIRSEKISAGEISRAVEIESDESWKIGDFRKNTKVPCKENGWMLNCKLPRETPLEEQVLSLLAELRPKASGILKMSEKA